MPEVPPFLKALESSDPELLEQVMKVMQMVGAPGALDAKTKTLMSLLGDAILGHAEGCASLGQRARQMGASEAEIQETVRMAYQMGGLPALITALRCQV